MSESNYSIAASTTSGGTDVQNKSQLAIRTSKMEINLNREEEEMLL